MSCVICFNDICNCKPNMDLLTPVEQALVKIGVKHNVFDEEEEQEEQE